MQYELKKCQDQMGLKNDHKDDKTRWELIPLDCLESIARVYTEGAKKYGDNNWQNLENGYERYKGALLRHLYAAESETFDEETGCRHLAQVAWNAITLLWLSKHTISGETKTIEQIEHEKKVADFEEILSNVEDIIKADCDARESQSQDYMFTDKHINKAINKCPLERIKIRYRKILNYEDKNEEAKSRDGRFVYTVEAWYNNNPVLKTNLLKQELIHFLKNAVEEIEYERNEYRRKVGPDTNQSTSNASVSETDIKGHE